MAGVNDSEFSPLGTYTREASVTTLLRIFQLTLDGNLSETPSASGLEAVTDYQKAISFRYIPSLTMTERNAYKNTVFDEAGFRTNIVKNIVGTPELVLVGVNLTERGISSFEFQCSFEDSFGAIVSDFTGNTVFTGVVESADLSPLDTSKEHYWSGDNWNCYTFNLATWSLAYKVDQNNITISKIKFADGEVLIF